MRERIGIYPGSFDPLTNGHIDIIRRALTLVDHLVVAIGVSASKTPFLSLEDRCAIIEAEMGPIARKIGARLSTTSFSGLVVDAADKHKATVIIRGLRGAVDYEYEESMVGMNRIMNPKVETVFLSASPETGFISSTLVRQIAGMGGDITPFVSKRVARKVMSRIVQLDKAKKA